MSTSPSRRVFLESCQNFRDLGGYLADDGRRVRWRKVFRADTLHRLTAADVDTLNGLGIVAVIDLRSSAEVESGRVTANVSADYHHLPMFDEVVQRDRGPLPERPPPGEAYIQMLSGAGPAIAGAFRVLLGAGGRPSVIHCTAGKDRTGILAGLVLSALGVSDDDIVADYVMTNDCRAEREAYLEVHDPSYLAMLQSMPSWVREADAASMRATLAHVATECGSTHAYLGSLGISDGEIAALQDALLEA